MGDSVKKATTMMVIELDCQPNINFGSRINPITEFGSIPWDIHGRCGAENQSPKDGKLERPYLGAVRTTEDPARLSKIDLSHFIKLFPRMTENISHAHLTLVKIWNNVFKITLSMYSMNCCMENMEERLTKYVHGKCLPNIDIHVQDPISMYRLNRTQTWGFGVSVSQSAKSN